MRSTEELNSSFQMREGLILLRFSFIHTPWRNLIIYCFFNRSSRTLVAVILVSRRFAPSFFSASTVLLRQ